MLSALRSLPLVLLVVMVPSWSQSPRVLSSSDIREALDKLATVGSVLYIAAHPDDENTAFLATMVHGRNVRAAYLSMTRGEGGQNLIGNEQGDLLGMVRTQELVAARRIDGSEQFFTRAIDFGYSKTTEETLRLWGKDSVIADVVRVIRRFRPDVVVTRFTSTQGGHGNHTSSAVIALEAFTAAGDPARYADQLGDLEPWSPRRIVWNGFRPQGPGAATSLPNAVQEDLGAFDPVIGRSYSELAGEARTMHKSQGFGAAQNRGSAMNIFQHLGGDTARTDLFDGIDITWLRFPGGEAVQRLADSLRAAFIDTAPSQSVPLLIRIRQEIGRIAPDPWKTTKLAELDDLILACGGIWVDALAAREELVREDSAQITLTAVNRTGIPFTIAGWGVDGLGIRQDGVMDIPANAAVSRSGVGVVPANMPVRQPSWLQMPSGTFRYEYLDRSRIGEAEDPPVFTARVSMVVQNLTLERRVPVRWRRVDPVEGEIYRPVIVTSALRVSCVEPIVLFPSRDARKIDVQVEALRPMGQADVRLELPEGWRSEPASRSVELAMIGERHVLSFTVKPANGARSGVGTAVVTVGKDRYTTSTIRTEYKHIPPQVLHVPSTVRLIRADIRALAKTVGYIMGAGDEVDRGLRQLGCRVDLVTDDEIFSSDLRRFDAVVVGVRAFNTRPALFRARSVFEAYVRQGGTLLIQYQIPGRGGSEDFAPLPFVIARDRVTEEDAEMRFLAPRHRALNRPNVISPEDFEGWTQERGLYYASSWGKEFTPVLGANDSGEPSRDGGLLIAPLGKGHVVYTGLSFFRQIPAAVPGAYRLLANLISLSK